MEFALTAERASFSDAHFSEDKIYRYWLMRCWDDALPTIFYVLLNPSTADETVDDPTMRRCINYAKTWGYGEMFTLNIFALRSTDPRALFINAAAGVDPVGELNNWWMSTIAGASPQSIVVCGWGDAQARNLREQAMVRDRGAAVTKLLEDAGCLLKCFGRTDKGNPKHPLYLRADAKLEAFYR